MIAEAWPLNAPYLVFTDLDGTLLDHHSYTAEPARPALARLAAMGALVVIASSKTGSEIARLTDELDLRGPVIAENGAVVNLPEHCPGREGIETATVRYDTIVALLAQLRERNGFRFAGFHDLGSEQVAQLTGLTREAAQLACQRQGSEPILWQGSEVELQRFSGLLAEQGLSLVRGGRFHHVLAADVDKAGAVVNMVTGLRACGWQGSTIGLGDAPNDHAMLGVVDYPVVVNNPDSPTMPPLQNPRILITRQTGPAGWREAIDTLLDKLQGTQS